MDAQFRGGRPRWKARYDDKYFLVSSQITHAFIRLGGGSYGFRLGLFKGKINVSFTQVSDPSHGQTKQKQTNIKSIN